MDNTELLDWKVHTKGLFDEISTNPECGVLRQPLNILGSILHEWGV